jgi:hypothetical protein
VTAERATHSAKHVEQTRSTAEGMQSDEREEQAANAKFRITESLEAAANVTVESARHPAKEQSESFSTDAGSETNESDEQSSNARASMSESLEFGSNVITKRE